MDRRPFATGRSASFITSLPPPCRIQMNTFKFDKTSGKRGLNSWPLKPFHCSPTCTGRLMFILLDQLTGIILSGSSSNVETEDYRASLGVLYGNPATISFTRVKESTTAGSTPTFPADTTKTNTSTKTYKLQYKLTSQWPGFRSTQIQVRGPRHSRGWSTLS